MIIQSFGKIKIKYMKIIIFRPNLSTLNNNNDSKELKEAFETMKLIDKTICDDRIVYVFDEKYKK